MASKLIRELKQDHAALEEMLARAKGMNISDDEAREMLLATKARLLSHLSREDTELYPALYRQAENDPALKLTLDFYARNMAQITKNAIHFLDKYADGGTGIEFAKDFAKFFTTLSTRIRDEERTIYKEFEKLNG